MRCGALVRYEIRGKKHPKRKLMECYYRAMDYPLRLPREEYEVCDGIVIPKLELESDGGCCCCCSCTIELHYQCNKCGSTCFPELPVYLDDVNLLLQEKLQLTDELREEYLEKYLKLQEAYKKQQAEALARLELRKLESKNKKAK